METSVKLQAQPRKVAEDNKELRLMLQEVGASDIELNERLVHCSQISSPLPQGNACALAHDRTLNPEGYRLAMTEYRRCLCKRH